MKVYFSNLGCKLNQAELERLARQFHAAGHRVVGALDDADLHVVNTCTVTAGAARDSRKAARRGGRHGGRREEGRLRTVLTGCWATEQPAVAAGLPGVDLVVENGRKEGLLGLVHEAFPEWPPAAGGPAAADGAGAAEAAAEPEPACPPAPLDLAFGNTRPLVKIEDGCGMRCAFCIIPSTRGGQRSRPVAAVVAEVAALVGRGAREVVLTGVQISAYRDGGARLADLVEAVLERTAVPRLRLTSIAPWRFDRRLLALLAHPRVCRHVHLSLQSGCDATLRRMRRPYTAARFAELVTAIREAAPGAAVTTDVIAGFPGETDAEFAASLAFVERMAFARIHAFPYSRRAGTAAEGLAGQVPHEVKRARMAALLAVAADADRRFHAAHLGATATVLWDRRRGDPLRGTTDNYLRVFTPAGEAGANLANTLTPTDLVGLTAGGLVGRPRPAQPSAVSVVSVSVVAAVSAGSPSSAAAASPRSR